MSNPIQPGDCFNKLTAISYSNRIKNKIMWLFSCQCGGTTIAEASRVQRGEHKSCGCIKPIQAGDVFNKLTAVAPAGKSKHSLAMWEFICECGTLITTVASPVKLGVQKSCGCISSRLRINGIFIPQPDIGMTKICNTCGQEKDMTLFKIDSRSPISNKHHARCNQCEQIRLIKRLNNNPILRIRNSISSLVRYSLKHGKGGESCWKYLPYTKIELMDHLESKFETWMSWSNHGLYRLKTWDDNNQSTWVWNIDHIVPMISFGYSTMNCKEFKDCWALSNLRPLSAKENIIKGDRLL